MKNRKIKLLYITPWFFVGGAERVLIDLISGIDKSKFEIKVLYFKNSDKENEEWKKSLDNLGVSIALVEMKKKFDIKFFIKLFFAIKKNNPDIVHTQLFLADFYGRIAAKLAGVKTIVSTEHNLNYSEGVLKKYLKVFSNKFSSRTVAVSDAVKEYAIKHEKLNRKKVEVIRNGINIDKFYTKNRDYRNKDIFVISSIGRLTNQKGHDVLLDAIGLVKNKNIKIKIAGDGVNKDMLLEKIEKNNQKLKVKICGVVSDVASLLNESDIFVLPSRWEGLGLVVLEAGASGLPVIASRVDGVKEIIGINDGLLVEAGSANEIAYAIDVLVESESKREIYGKNLQKKVCDNFNLEKMIQNYQELYIKLSQRH